MEDTKKEAQVKCALFHNKRLKAALIALLLIAVSLAANAQADDASCPALFAEYTGDTSAFPEITDAGVTAYRYVYINYDILDALTVTNNVLCLNLFDSINLAAVITDIEEELSSDGSSITYKGSIADSELSAVILIRTSDIFVGKISSPTYGVYQIRYVTSDAYVVLSIDTDDYPSEYEGPISDITVNGASESIKINKGDDLSVKVFLSPGRLIGYSADWWLFAETPYGDIFYNALDTTFTWQYGFGVSFQGSLDELLGFDVLNVNTKDLIEGVYTFTFGIDDNLNGLLDYDGFYSKSVAVNIE
ncbi:secreted protein [Candidatus Magnetoovum chiemensis]|nr:secreted protein [Candidatus Magnetoovum chiemensis]